MEIEFTQHATSIEIKKSDLGGQIRVKNFEKKSRKNQNFDLFADHYIWCQKYGLSLLSK